MIILLQFLKAIRPDRKETLEMKVKKCIQPTTFKQMKFYSHSPVFPMLSKSSMTLDWMELKREMGNCEEQLPSLTVGWLLVIYRLTVGNLLASCQQSVPRGAVLHNYREMHTCNNSYLYQLKYQSPLKGYSCYYYIFKCNYSNMIYADIIFSWIQINNLHNTRRESLSLCLNVASNATSQNRGISVCWKVHSAMSFK